MANDNKGINKIWIFAGIGVVIIVALIVFWPAIKTSKTGKNNGNNMSKTKDPTTDGGKTYSEDSIRTNPDGSMSDGVTPEFLMEQYKEWAQYPPNSRPISNNNHDLVKPFYVEESPIIMVDEPTAKEPNGYKCHLQPKTWAVIGPSAEMYVKLECRDSNNQAIPVKINDDRVFREDMDGKKLSTIRADFNDDGRDGDDVAKDNITTFRWRPMKGDWGQISMEVDIVYGREGKKAKVTASFFSSPGKPAEVTNVYREMMEDGSLAVYSTVQVYKAGNYHMEANLKEATEGNYIAFATFDGSLKSGANEVRFLFFGKILKDKGYDGPYLVTDVRGHRVNLPFDPEIFSKSGPEVNKIFETARTTEPDKELVLPSTEDFKTKPYNMSLFSNKEWQSEDKSNRLKELEQLAQQK